MALKWRMRPIEWIVCGLVVLILCLLIVPSIRGGESRTATCALCRATRVEERFLGSESSRVDDTVCSEWYAAHVEPTHEHAWVPSGGTTIHDIFRRPIGVACSATRNPIWRIKPEDQLAIYERFTDYVAAKSLFDDMADATHPYMEAEGVALALQAWQAAGFAGTWEEWAAEAPSRDDEE